MRVKGLFSTFSIILLLSALLAIGIASAQDVLTIDERRSYVWTETGEKIPYVDFLYLFSCITFPAILIS